MSAETKVIRAERLCGNYARDLGELYSLVRIKLAWYSIIQTESRPVSVRYFRVDSGKVELEVTASTDEFKPFLDPLMREIVRNFINDIFNVTCEFNIYLKNLFSGKRDIFDYNDDNIDSAIQLSNRFLPREGKQFFDFFRLVRNSMVHHGGRHNKKNSLNHDFEGRRFETTGAVLNQPIPFFLSEVLAFYSQSLRHMSFASLSRNSHFAKLLGE
jgi:hypothetical protein